MWYVHAVMLADQERQQWLRGLEQRFRQPCSLVTHIPRCRYGRGVVQLGEAAVSTDQMRTVRGEV